MTTATIRDLHVSLERDGARSDVLRGIDLDIAPGEIVGLVGESGSGKSMLAMSLLGLLPDAARPEVTGAVTVQGTDMVHGTDAERRAARRSSLGAVFQDPMTSLNPTMRIGRQITEAGPDRAGAVALLDSMGVPDPELRFIVYPHELSGGLRQRVMAAIAMAGRPALIVADEPTTALDVTVQAQLLDLLQELRDDHGCSVLLITHDLGVASRIADRIAVMYAGRLAEVGPTAAVLGAAAHPYTAGLLRSRLSLALDREARLPALPADTLDPAERLVGCPYRARCPLAVARCATDMPGLDASVPAADHAAACWRDADTVRATGGGTATDPPAVTDPTAATDADDAGRASRPTADTTTREARTTQAERPTAATPTAGATPTVPAAADAVVVEDLVCTYTTGRGRRARTVEAVRGVSFRVPAGRSLAIVGESGSGKSTILRAVAGLVPARSGRITVAEGGAQMVFQDAGSSLTPWMTVGETLRERLVPARLGRTETDRRVAEALDAIGLPATVARLRPVDLSGGQRQRVALARATIVRPAVLLCDEPTSALDASLAAVTLNTIRDMRRELAMTVLFVTHDLAVARLMGDHIAVVERGRVIETGPADAVIHDPQEQYTRTLVASVPEIAVPA
ncbi:ABC transporter ATP-binding protein [Curtobacterium herbarum]|uniref:ABC transporter domain-containing protein n=1 Tax=Curtobacterium herbarum TaxID=150122 RepID=A0ABP4K643_9MICO|nr:ABC transporter ATP-binding protein [Curtobacterium herbarum]MBM7476914.1 peptide/nickel transport system ATP-binding protein [Curtobacterium herbarum]MCS6545076.1 ABC transporter ATP-binding protein [Curtobacterium herbarum]